MDMNGEQDIVLRGKFAVYPGTEKYDLSVTKTKILMVRGESTDRIEDEIVLQDVIGCHVLHEKKKPGISSYLCVFSYPIKKKKFGSGVVRRRVTRTFTVDTENSYHGNLMLAEMWKMVIKRLIAGELISTKEDIENGSLKTRNLLVLVNPYSGRKKAMSMYKEKVQPMFAEAEIKHTVKTTEYPGHAKDIAKKLQLEEWDGIVVVSGDGLVHEVINGLMDREDWSEAIKMPIGVVPGGSGNALAAAVVYASTGQILSNNLELDAIFEVLKGKQRNMSLVAIETEAGQRFYSFLNFAWGFIADVDIESERFRKLGPVRFAIGCALRVANMRLYQGRVSYLPASNRDAFSYGTTGSLKERLNGPIHPQKMPSSTKIDSSITTVSNDCTVHGTMFENDSSSVNVAMNGDSSEVDAPPKQPSVSDDQLHLKELNDTRTISNASLPHLAKNHTEHAGSGDLEPSERKKQAHEDNRPIAWKDSALCYYTRTSLDTKSPDDWVTIESEFMWVTSVYLSHLGNEMMGVPSARLDDDVMYIYTLRHGISKAKMISVLMGFEAGTHIERGGEYSFVAPCKAVRLEPFTFITGHMTVDGELTPHCAIQASVTPHKILVMSSVAE